MKAIMAVAVGAAALSAMVAVVPGGQMGSVAGVDDLQLAALAVAIEAESSE